MELLTNPFFTLGATMRDDKRRIMELAEEKSLMSDGTAVRRAMAVLTNPRRRLAAEIGWLPGLGPKRISEALSILTQEPAKVQELGTLPCLARANLFADALIRVIDQLPTAMVARWILEIADTHDHIEAAQTATLLNEERSVAGFPAVADLQVVVAELEGRRQYYRQAIKTALNQVPSPSLVEIMTMAVAEATDNGQRQGPILIDDLVDSFEVEAQGFLATETENIAALVQGIRGSVDRGEGHEHIERIVSDLEQVARNWDRVVQPMQLSARSRGTSHGSSHEIAGEIRGLAVHLFNEHDLLDISKRLTLLQQEVFAEVDSVAEQSVEDATALEEIAEQRSRWLAEREVRAESWRREITYEADVGVMFKNKLRISPEGVEWKSSIIPLEEIERVRWGGTSHSVNGIPTGTTYTIVVGGGESEATVVLRKKEVYSEFVDRLWKAAGVRLLTEMLRGLRAGRRYRFGAAVITDYGVELERRRFFSSSERVPCRWTDVVIGNGSGTFNIAKKDDKKVAVELPYQEMDNVHILEAAMRVFWKSPKPRLSDLLEETS